MYRARGPVASLSVNERLLSALTETLFPDWPSLTPDDRRQLATRVTAFVAGQIEALPRFLRFPYRLALIGFNALALLAGGRPFSRLSEQRRRRYLRLWSDSPIGLMRDFVKLVRSCAVLAAFDHPLMTRRLEEVTEEERRGGAS